jgi:hypothetical protein
MCRIVGSSKVCPFGHSLVLGAKAIGRYGSRGAQAVGLTGVHVPTGTDELPRGVVLVSIWPKSGARSGNGPARQALAPATLEP